MLSVRSIRTPAAPRPRAALISVVVIALSLAACRGDSSSKPSPGSGDVPFPTRDHAPVISGSPPQSAAVGLPYYFKPSASDPDGDRLVFESIGQPDWMTFDPTNGQLFGVPPTSAAGTTATIVIHVSDGKTVTSLARFKVQVSATSGGTGAALLRWNAPTTTTSGAPLTDLAGFRVYYGKSQPQFDHVLEVANPVATEVTIGGLGAGTWYFAVSAYTRSGAESSRSGVVQKYL